MLIIKNLPKKDLDKAAHVFTEAFNSVGQKWTYEIAKERLEMHYDENTYWGAYVDNELVGILAAQIQPVLDHRDLYVDVVAVLPKHQKQGIGTKLWNEAEVFVNDNNLGGFNLLASTEISYNWLKSLGFEDSSWVNIFRIYE